MMKPKYLLFIIIPFLIILFNFRLLVFNYDFYEKNFDNNLDSEFVKDNMLTIFNYLKGNSELNDNFNEREKMHMHDVKNLINMFLLIFYIFSLIFIFILIYFIYKKDFRAIGINLVLGGSLTLLIILIFYLFNFNNLFYNFHILMFNNELWLLNPETDLLINLFNERFFFGFFRGILLNSLVTSCILILAGGFIKHVRPQY